MGLPPEGHIVAVADVDRKRAETAAVKGTCRAYDDYRRLLEVKAIEKGRSGNRDHLQNWFDCMRSRAKPAADVEIGHRSAVVCHLGNIARWVGRKLRWDPEKEIFPGDAEANAHLERPMREPYRLPKLV